MARGNKKGSVAFVPPLCPPLSMSAIEEQDWSFKQFVAAERVERLEKAGSPPELIDALATSLGSSIEKRQIRVGIDSKENKFVECRAILQFPVEPELYDWFFNARTGYRAQFWLSPETGSSFNHDIVAALSQELSHRLPPSITARKIEVRMENESRTEESVGTVEVSRDAILKSLVPAESKIWICENRYSVDDLLPPEQIGLSVLCEAARSRAKLDVGRWASAINPKTCEVGEGLRAPFPDANCSWLDLKGGFLCCDGELAQIKPQDERAKSIHLCGWT